jgi:hypothetical protein
MHMKYLPDTMTHEMLASFMPFNSAWTDDGTGNPCQYSVMLAVAMIAVHPFKADNEKN